MMNFIFKCVFIFPVILQIQHFYKFDRFSNQSWLSFMIIFGLMGLYFFRDKNEKPIQNLALNGGSKLQLMFYGIFPDILPKYINYILYRLENIIRSTLIVGFVGASGLGFQFKLAMSYFKYSDILLYLIFYLILVYITDILSSLAKKWIK